MKYRREIDGLRALAVLPVILFHAGFTAFSGGFVGVDVFFVISGYLITTIIQSEVREGHFSVARFYERRARRILPALFLVLGACLPFAWLWLLPSDAKDFAASLVAVSLFASNVLFWLQSGYFDAAAELRPLLHTWSLAVEEQYYLLFPLLMVAIGRFSKRWLATVIVLIAIASLLVAQWGTVHGPSANFFLLPSRAFELLLGALAALYLADRLATEPQPRALGELGSLGGMVMLAYAVFRFDSSTPFPGVYALVPTIGTLLVILYATPATWVGRLLGHPLLVGVGLISYSAYLWHQPLFAFAKHRTLAAPDGHVFLGLSVVALGLAYLSWRFVEAPFRDRGRVDRVAIFGLAVLGSAIFIAIGMTGFLTNGAARWTDERARVHDVEQRLRVNYGLDVACRSEFTTSAKCRTSDKPEVMVWGDSYAMHLISGLMAAKPGLGLVQMTKSVCGPFLGIAPVNEKYTVDWANQCIKHNDAVFAWLQQAKSVKVVVLSSTFGQFMNDGARVLLRDGRVVEGRAHAARAFDETLAKLRDAGVVPVIVSPTPGDGSDIGRCLAKSAQLRLMSEQCDFARSVAESRQQHVIRFLQALEPANRVVWLSNRICDATRCRAAIGEVLVYRDDGHLSHESSEYLVKAIGIDVFLPIAR